MSRIIGVIFGLFIVMSFYVLITPSNGLEDDPTVIHVIGWGSHKSIFIHWIVEGDSDPIKGFDIYRGYFPDDDSLSFEWGKNSSYEPYIFRNGSYHRYFEDTSVDPDKRYIYRVIPVFTDGRRGDGEGTVAALIYGDRDNDGLPDFYEMNFDFDYNDPSDGISDPDGDGVTNYVEYLFNSNPLDKNSTPWVSEKSNPDRDIDIDLDGMPDTWEIQYNLDPMDSSDANGDIDQDGISNLLEYQSGTIPDHSDKQIIEEEKIEENGGNEWVILLILIFIMILISIFGYISENVNVNE